MQKLECLVVYLEQVLIRSHVHGIKIPVVPSRHPDRGRISR